MSVPAIPLAAIRQPALLYDADGRCVEANRAALPLAGRALVGGASTDVPLTVRGAGGGACTSSSRPSRSSKT